MNRFSSGLVAALAAFFVLTPSVQSQESADPSLAEAAREQRELHSSPKSGKSYGNDDVEPPGSSPSWKTQTAAAKASAPAPKFSKPGPETPAVESAPEFHPTRSVMDHRTDGEDRDTDDDLIVPEGTELKIDFTDAPTSLVANYAARVATPVRVGFATPIPASSIANVQVVGRHYPWLGEQYNSGYYEVLEVTQLMVEDVAYSVQTDRVGRPWPVSSPSELTFKLLKPLSIPR